MLDRTWLLAAWVICATGVFLLFLRHPRISELFRQHIPYRPQRRLFLAAISFVLTFRCHAFTRLCQLPPSWALP